MTPVDFCYWLQGALELNPGQPMSREQMEVIQNHLNLVFEHTIDPMREAETAVNKEDLQATHDGDNPPKPRPPLYRC